MRFTLSQLAAVISAWLLAAVWVRAATAPRYGGTLRVELYAASASLDPRAWRIGSLEAATNEKLAGLLFERLVALDNYGRIQPMLATDWSHDTATKRWQFTIRGGVKFSDGTALTAADVVTALQPLLPANLSISAGAANTVVVQSAVAASDLLEQFASGRFFVYRVAASGELVGTGPFVLGPAPPGGGSGAPRNANAAATGNAGGTVPINGTHLYFRANEDAWSGRPFVDSVDVALGVPTLRAMFDLQLGKADLIELSPELVPRARQANLRVWSSDPVVLYGLRFDNAQSAVADPRLREALSLALDRGTMANVLLQKQAEPAAALLPQWLSGYAFLFNVEANLERAKELRRTMMAGSGSAGVAPLRLRVDAAEDLPRLLGERVAVNARQASILVQVVSRPTLRVGGGAASVAPEPASGLHLFAWRYSSLSGRCELDAMLAAYNLAEPADGSGTSSDREQLYARERRLLEDWRVLPLVVQAESVGIGAAVRDWMAARWGEWRLADVWLDTPIEGGSTVSLKASEVVKGSETHPLTSNAGVGAKP